MPGPAEYEKTIMRKLAYKRTELYLKSEAASVMEIDRGGKLKRHNDKRVYHTLPPAFKGEGATGEAARRCLCWHCSEPLDAQDAVPIPRHFDPMEGVFLVFGATCCLGCAKAYILEHTTFDRGEHLSVLAKMARDVYDVNAIAEAPPRASLVAFGGLFDRAAAQPASTRRIVEAPFVSYNMVVEEKSNVPQPRIGVERDRPQECVSFDRPIEGALFEEFLAKQQADERERSGDAGLVASHAPPFSQESATRAGPMARFVR